MSVEFYRESLGTFDSRTRSRETLSRWTGRTWEERLHTHHPLLEGFRDCDCAKIETSSFCAPPPVGGGGGGGGGGV